MMAITLWQPWASLLASGIKPSETRDWAPPRYLWGERIAIHAAKRPISPRDAATWPMELHVAIARWRDQGGTEMPYGAVLATPRLVECGRVQGQTWLRSQVPEMDGRYAECRLGLGVPTRLVRVDGLGDYSKGRWVWFFDDFEAFDEPIEARGYQKLWNWEPPESEGLTRGRD